MWLSYSHFLEVPEGQRIGCKRQRQEIEEAGEEEGNKGEGGKRYLSQWDKGLSLDREETDVAHRQMAVYKGKEGNLMLG